MIPEATNGFISFILKKFIFKIYWTWITLTIPIRIKEINVENAAPTGPIIGIKKEFNKRLITNTDKVL